MNHQTDMLRQSNIAHLSNNVHFLQQGQQPPGPPSQPHHMSMLQNASNQNPALAMGSAQPQNPTPAQMYHQHHLTQQRRNPPLPAGPNGQGLSAPSVQAPHMNGIGPNQLQGIGYGNSMMPGGTQGVRRTVSQPGLNQTALNQMAGIHPGQPGMGGVGGMGGMGGMGMNSQGIPHQNMRMPPQQMNRMPQQQNSQIQGQDVGLGMNTRPQQMQGNQGMSGNAPRPQASQQSLVGNQSMNFQPPMPMPQQTPQMSPHSTPQSTPGGPLQQPMNAGPQNRTPDNSMYAHYSSPQFPQGMHNPRLSGSGNQFGFPQTPDSSNQDMGSGVSNPNVPSNRGGFGMTNLTPAQQFDIQRNGDFSHFMAPSMSHQPSHSHPPSQPPNMPHQMPQPHHQGGEHIGVGGPMPNLQRPQSQPQTHVGPTPRPPSQQAGPSRTPHLGQPQLPTMPPHRMPSGVPNPQNPIVGGQPGPSQPPSMAAMPPQPQPGGQNLANQPSPPFIGAQRPSNTAVPSSVPVPPGSLPENSGPQPAGANYQQKMMMNLQGQGIIRLLQFSGALSSDNRNKLGLIFWESLVKDYFTPKAILKYTLWKDNQRNEAKPFEIGTPILPRFFLVTSQSGVHSMSISLDGAREKSLGSSHLVVECVTAVWTYRYSNGYTIQLCGPLTAHLVLSPSSTNAAAGSQPSFSMKFEHLQFDANVHHKLIQVDAIVGPKIGRSPLIQTYTPGMNGMGSQPDRTQDRIHYERSSIPGEPVNAFGIPQATMRCLELAESIAQMTDLIHFSSDTGLGPLQSLKQFAEKIKDTPVVVAHMRMVANNNPVGPGFQKDGLMPTKSMTTNQAVTLIQPNNQQGPPPTLLNVPPSGDSSPSKQNKPAPTMPPQQPPQQPTPGTSVTPASTPAATTSASTTPSMAAATLKRKAHNDTASPTTDHAPPSKRQTRGKRRGTGGG